MASASQHNVFSRACVPLDQRSGNSTGDVRTDGRAREPCRYPWWPCKLKFMVFLFLWIFYGCGAPLCGPSGRCGAPLKIKKSPLLNVARCWVSRMVWWIQLPWFPAGARYRGNRVFLHFKFSSSFISDNHLDRSLAGNEARNSSKKLG